MSPTLVKSTPCEGVLYTNLPEGDGEVPQCLNSFVYSIKIVFTQKKEKKKKMHGFSWAVSGQAYNLKIHGPH